MHIYYTAYISLLPCAIGRSVVYRRCAQPVMVGEASRAMPSAEASDLSIKYV